jgi:hypothetical protein
MKFFYIFNKMLFKHLTDKNVIKKKKKIFILLVDFYIIYL